MKALKIFILIGTFQMLSSCKIGPQEIDYGNDACSFCQMTIVDKIHAAEIVTRKGKVYKFDASECMVNFRNDFDIAEIELYLTNIYTEPRTLVDATQATFLRSEKLPSPMGAFLTGFKNQEDAVNVQFEKEGTLYNWDELLEHLNK
ncbi:MAG: nitrous oxide reductase accessory protein NosL [Flavobacteriales bacterium]|nr:nitrous oxide reductase accessory protein NosL [Flavobacteriales bacterium]